METPDSPLPIDASMITSAMLRGSGPMVAQADRVHSVESGQSTQHVPVEPPVHSQEAAEPPGEQDPDEQTGQPDIEEAAAKRYRIRPRSDNDAAILQEMARNPHLTIEQAASKLFPPAQAKVAAEQAQQTAETPVVDPIDALESEVDALQTELDEAVASFDLEKEAELKKTLRSKEKELRGALRKAAATPVAQSAQETTANQPVNEFDAATNLILQKDRELTVRTWPDAVVEGSPQYIKMREIAARLEAENDPLLESPRLNSALASLAAAELNIPAAQQKQAPVTRSTPGPATTAARRSEVTAPPVDVRSLAGQVNSVHLRSLHKI